MRARAPGAAACQHVGLGLLGRGGVGITPDELALGLERRRDAVARLRLALQHGQVASELLGDLAGPGLELLAGAIRRANHTDHQHLAVVALLLGERHQRHPVVAAGQVVERAAVRQPDILRREHQVDAARLEPAALLDDALEEERLVAAAALLLGLLPEGRVGPGDLKEAGAGLERSDRVGTEDVVAKLRALRRTPINQLVQVEPIAADLPGLRHPSRGRAGACADVGHPRCRRRRGDVGADRLDELGGERDVLIVRLHGKSGHRSFLSP